MRGVDYPDWCPNGGRHVFEERAEHEVCVLCGHIITLAMGDQQ